MKYFLVFILVLNLIPTSSIAQNDSTQIKNYSKTTFIKQQILPVSLIATGSLLNLGSVKNNIQNHIPNTNTNIEDYLQYTPMVQMYFFDIAGFNHKSSVFDQTKYLVISQLVSSIIVHSTKNITRVPRPQGALTSFPSGHTANAFVGATMVYHEFKDTDPFLAYSGFAVATATGILRMTNDAHWLPDVMVGAGIGILTVNLVYHFEPLKNWQPFQKNKNLSFTPVITPNSIGLTCRF